jgi:two-component system LytT family response regulator
MKTTNSYKTIIIDDEAEARDVLFALLQGHPEIDVVATAEDADGGLEAIVKHTPDLIFLDIRMPRKTGFDMVHELRNLQLNPAIIFVTAYDEYAIQAFKVAAFDYLLKPVDPADLAETVNRFQKNRTAADFVQKIDHLLHHLHHDDRLKLNTRAGFLLIDPAEVFYATADGNYTVINFTSDQSEIVTLNLGSLFKLLPHKHFVRISRSTLVNLSYLYRIDRKKRTCELRKDSISIPLPVSREFIRDISTDEN